MSLGVEFAVQRQLQTTCMTNSQPKKKPQRNLVTESDVLNDVVQWSTNCYAVTISITRA